MKCVESAVKAADFAAHSRVAIAVVRLEASADSAHKYSCDRGTQRETESVDRG